MPEPPCNIYNWAVRARFGAATAADLFPHCVLPKWLALLIYKHM